MKILAIGETRDVRSGWGRYAHEVLNQFEKRGIQYEFVSSNELRSPSFKNAFYNISLIRRKIKKGVSTIHAFDVWPFGVYALIANVGLGRPLFVTGVGTYSIPPRRGLKSWLMKMTLRRSREVFCISNYTLNLLKETEPRGNYTIVHWGTSTMPKVTPEEEKEYKEKFKIPAGKAPVIITIGQFTHRKGQLNTLQAVKILKEKYKDILYVMVGGAKTGYINTIREFARENDLEGNLLIVENQKTDKELSYLYSQADIYAMNSNNEGLHYEGFGLVFIEAAQLGKPAVGSSGCGIEDAIVDEKTGLLTKQGDARDIAEKIERVLAHKEAFGKAAQEYSKQFSWEKTVDTYIKSYQRP